MIRRLIIPLAVLAGLAPGVAAAHTPAVADNCHNLTVTLTNYEGTTPNNRVTVTIDGTAQTFDYGTSFSRSFTWSPTAPHVWNVSIDANRSHGDPTEFDRTFNGTEKPCQSTTTTTSTISTTSTTTSPPTTTIPVSTTTNIDTSSSSPSTTTPPTTTTPTPTSSDSSTTSLPVTTTPTSVPVGSTSPTAPAERLDNLPVTGSTTDPWWIIPPIAVGLLLTLAARRPRTP